MINFVAPEPLGTAFTLEEFEVALAALPQGSPVLLDGHPISGYHSYRGDYHQIALGWVEYEEEPRRCRTVGELLAATRAAIGADFEGWKGGTYTMLGYTDVYASEPRAADGRRPCMFETIGLLGDVPPTINIRTVRGMA